MRAVTQMHGVHGISESKSDDRNLRKRQGGRGCSDEPKVNVGGREEVVGSSRKARGPSRIVVDEKGEGSG